jgi:hypothetical protein
MEQFLSILRLALDRGWALGALLALFFGGILVGGHYGIAVPESLQQWSTAGLLFGVSVLLVSIASHVSHGIRNLFQRFGLRLRLRKTLRELTRAERTFLRPYIIQGENTQYEPINDGVANGLQAKGIIYRASNISLPGVPGMLFPWNLQPYARRALDKNRNLLD